MLTTKQFEELLMAQASHQIADHFHQQCTKTQLIEIYTAAYKFHKGEADKFKGLQKTCSQALKRVQAQQPLTLRKWASVLGTIRSTEVAVMPAMLWSQPLRRWITPFVRPGPLGTLFKNRYLQRQKLNLLSIDFR